MPRTKNFLSYSKISELKKFSVNKRMFMKITTKSSNTFFQVYVLNKYWNSHISGELIKCIINIKKSLNCVMFVNDKDSKSSWNRKCEFE